MTSPAQRLAELRAAGWTFTYSPHSLFIAAEHPLGGKQSICELRTVNRNGFDADSFGEFIADYLNNAAAIAARERELEARIATLECHLDFLGWSSDGIQAARDQLATKDAEIAKLRAENQTAAANSEIGGLESLVEDLQEDLYGEDCE